MLRINWPLFSSDQKNAQLARTNRSSLSWTFFSVKHGSFFFFFCRGGVQYCWVNIVLINVIKVLTYICCLMLCICTVESNSFVPLNLHHLYWTLIAKKIISFNIAAYTFYWKIENETLNVYRLYLDAACEIEKIESREFSQKSFTKDVIVSILLKFRPFENAKWPQKCICSKQLSYFFRFHPCHPKKTLHLFYLKLLCWKTPIRTKILTVWWTFYDTDHNFQTRHQESWSW